MSQSRNSLLVKKYQQGYRITDLVEEFKLARNTIWRILTLERAHKRNWENPYQHMTKQRIRCVKCDQIYPKAEGLFNHQNQCLRCQDDYTWVGYAKPAMM